MTEFAAFWGRYSHGTGQLKMQVAQGGPQCGKNKVKLPFPPLALKKKGVFLLWPLAFRAQRRWTPGEEDHPRDVRGDFQT
jgi:hypothetical protein